MRYMDEQERKELGQKIKSARKQKGLSQEQLAELVGNKVGTISKYEQGNRTPDIGMLVKISEALECDITELAGPDKVEVRVQEHPERTIQSYIDWIRNVDIPLELHSFIDDDGIENVAVVVNIDGVLTDVSGSIFSIMEMSRSHFLLLAKQFGGKWRTDKPTVKIDNLP